MSTDLFSQFRSTIEHYQMIAENERVLVAVSGGPDSMALLHLFWRLMPGQIGVFHLDHNFRSDSKEDANLVEMVSNELGVPSFIFSRDIPSYLEESGESKQQGARKVRYRLLHRCARENGFHKIALAHHADDQVETVLMRIIRGSGLLGLAAMSPVSGPLIRPLISISKEKILSYCQEQGVRYRIDSSNRENYYFRNRIRNELIPLLEKKYNPNIRSSLLTIAELAKDDERELSARTEDIIKKHCFRTGGQVGIDKSRFLSLSISLQRRVLRRLIEDYKGDTRQIDFDHVELIRKRVKDDKPFEYSLPQVSVVVTANSLLLGTFQVPRWDEGLVGGRKDAGYYFISTTEYRVDNLPPRTKWDEDFDRARLCGPICVRRRRPGDRLIPFGKHSEKKVKDLLIDGKIPAQLRDDWPLICDQEHILWIPGVRRSERGRVTENTREVVRVSIEPKHCHRIPPVL